MHSAKLFVGAEVSPSIKQVSATHLQRDKLETPFDHPPNISSTVDMTFSSKFHRRLFFFPIISFIYAFLFNKNGCVNSEGFFKQEMFCSMDISLAFFLGEKKKRQKQSIYANNVNKSSLPLHSNVVNFGLFSHLGLLLMRMSQKNCLTVLPHHTTSGR